MSSLRIPTVAYPARKSFDELSLDEVITLARIEYDRRKKIGAATRERHARQRLAKQVKQAQRDEVEAE
jgi:hypothetical protein